MILAERLVNVLAHEYCHLANFMISGIKNNPHGKEFKEWSVAPCFALSVPFGSLALLLETNFSLLQGKSFDI